MLKHFFYGFVLENKIYLMLRRNINLGQSFLDKQYLSKSFFSKFNNTKDVDTLLEKFKKSMNLESYNQILNVNKSTNPIHLFRINGFTKIFFLVSRYQIIAYCIGGGFYTLFTIPSKWKKLNELEKKEDLIKREAKEIYNNRLKIIVGTVVLFLSASLGCYITNVMGKRLIKNIYWNTKEGLFEFDYFSLFGFTKKIKAKPFEIVPLQKPRRFDSTIQWKFAKNKEGYEYISTKGTGSWSNKSFFEYILENVKN